MTMHCCLARKQNTIKFVTYVAEQTHELQNNSFQMWGRKKLPKLLSFADSFTLRVILSLYNESYAYLLVDLSNHNNKSDKKAHNFFSKQQNTNDDDKTNIGTTGKRNHFLHVMHRPFYS